MTSGDITRSWPSTKQRWNRSVTAAASRPRCGAWLPGIISRGMRGPALVGPGGGAGEAVGGDRVGVRLREPLREPGVVAPGVAPAVPLAEVPVRGPLVDAPSGDPPDEALGAVERGLPPAPGVLGPLHACGRVDGVRGGARCGGREGTGPWGEREKER
ncbi:hypothetical protein GCM10027160_04680 [Streptomyces calidiresistens]